MPAMVVLIGETTSPFAAPLQKQYTTYWVRSGKKGLMVAQTHQAEIVILDAVSLGTNGERICRKLHRSLNDCHLVHIHPGPRKEVNSPAPTVLIPPLSGRMLINTLEHLLSSKARDMLRCGPFALDIERRILIVADSEEVLTPKQAALIEVFLRHPNQTLEREWLMQQVWQTTYTEDTRTLNVHIRHIREIIEVDASQPQYIQTVRGVGYRFEVSEK